MKKITFIYGYVFHRLLPILRRGCFCVWVTSFLISCASVPQQTYLTNTSLSDISKVAIVASTHAPEVSYSRTSREAGSSVMMVPLFPLLGLAAMGMEASARSGEDSEHAAKIKERVDLSQIEDKMAQSFIRPLTKGNCFQTIEYVKDKNQDSRQLSSAGYNAVIRLSVRKILLERVPGDNVRLRAYVSGQMESLKSGKILWDREEVVLSSELHSLDYYKEHGLKELDALLDKAGKNLAYDFIYLK